MFEENLIQYALDGNIGLCPVCKKPLSVEKIDGNERDNAQVSCKRCNKSEFYTGTIKK